MKKPETPQEMIKWMIEDLAFIIKHHYVPDRTIQLAEEIYGIKLENRVDKELAQKELRRAIICMKAKEND
jgi:hypothetical protein